MKIASNGIQIHITERGSGALALVFLHYWGGSSRTWDRVIAALPHPYRTIATDHRGWGESDAPTSGYGLADLADDAQGVIEALNLQHFILVGHSMGGKVAQLLASRRPKGLAGLVLVAPSPPQPLAMPAETREIMASAYSTRETVVMALEQMLTAKVLSPKDLEQVIEDSLRGAPQAKAAWPRSTSLEDITHEVAAINVPTVVIAGELDRVDGVDLLKAELLSRIPHAVLHVLPDTGHLSPLESPLEIAKIINDFANARAVSGDKSHNQPQQRVTHMTNFPVHTIESAPERSKPALQQLQSAFGMIPNLIGAMSSSPILIDSLVGLFGKVHGGSFTEAQVQTVLLTDAVTNASTWAVAFHTRLALKEGIDLADVQAIREGQLPKDSKFAALSALAKTMIEKRGRLNDEDVDRFLAAGFGKDHLLEVIAAVAASTITNYTGSITKPPLDAPFRADAWQG